MALRHVWLHDDHFSRAAHIMTTVLPDTEAVLYDWAAPGQIGRVFKTVTGRSDFCALQKTYVERGARYSLQRPDPYANTPVDDMTLCGDDRDALAYYREVVLAPDNLHTQLRATLYDNDEFVVFAGWFRTRSRPWFDETDRTLAQAVLPALRAGVVAVKAVGMRPVDKGTMGSILDALPAPAFVLTSDAAVVFANRAACLQWPEPPAWLTAAVLPGASSRLAGIAHTATIDLEGRSLILVLPVTEPGERCVPNLPPWLRRLADLMAAGHSDKEIAELSELSLQSVRTGIARIYRRLGVHNRAEFIVRHGAMPPQRPG